MRYMRYLRYFMTTLWTKQESGDWKQKIGYRRCGGCSIRRGTTTIGYPHARYSRYGKVGRIRCPPVTTLGQIQNVLPTIVSNGKGIFDGVSVVNAIAAQLYQYSTITVIHTVKTRVRDTGWSVSFIAIGPCLATLCFAWLILRSFSISIPLFVIAWQSLMRME